MGTTIDSLQIEIQGNSNNAAGSIDALAKALKKLNKNGDVSDAVNNLNALRKSLHAFANIPSSASKIESLANSMKSLKKVGMIDLGSSLGGVKRALESLKSVDVDGVAPQIERIAGALAPLNNVKGSGFNAVMNGLKKLGEVTTSLDSATIDRFVAKIKELDEKLGPVSTKMVAIGNAFKGVNSKSLEASGGLSVFGGKVNTTTLNLQSLASVAQSAWSALQPIVNLLKHTIREAIQWDGIEYQFGNAFGEQADEYYDKITQITDALSLNKQMFMEHSAMAASMLKGFGVSSGDARKMGLGYTELAYDIWAAYNNVYKTFDGADGAMAAVRSAIAGEVEPIRRAGFTIVDSQLKITAANHGIAYSSEKATEAQKSYLRYLTLVDQAQSKGIVGTYASEMDNAEGVMRTFAQQLKSLAQAFGSLFLPILVKVMPYIQAFVELLTDAVHWVAALFGVEIQKIDFSDSFGGYSDSADSATESIGGTTKALKDLKNATLGIDELNVISPNTGNSGSGGSGGTGGAGSAGGFDVEPLWDNSIYENTKATISDIVQKVKDWLGLSEGVDTWAGFLETKLGRILSLVGLVGAGVVAWMVTKSFMDAVTTLKTILASPSYTIAIGVTLMLTGFVIEYTGLKSAVEKGLDGINFGEIVGGGLLGAGGAAILGAKIATWIASAFEGSAIAAALATAAENLGVGSVGAVGAALGASIAGIIAGIPAYFVGIYDACVNGLNWLNSLLIPAGSTAAAAGIGAIIGMLGGPIGAGAGALIGLAVGLVTDGVILIVQEWDKITAFLKKFFTETIPNMWNNFTNWISDLPQKIEKWFDDLWQPIKDFDWEQFGYDVGNKVGTAVKKICDAFKKFFTETLPEVGESVKTAFKTFFTQTLPKFFTDTLPTLRNTVKTEFITFFTVTLPNALADIDKWFEDVGTSIRDGIFEGLSSFGTAIKDFCNGFVKGFKDALGIKSPSKLFAEIGKHCLDGLLNAFNINAIKNKISSMWETAKSWWNKSKPALATYTPSIGDIKSKLSSAWTTAKNWWSKSKGSLSYTPTVGSIKDKLSSAWTTAKNWWNKNVKLSIPSLSFKVTYTSKGLNTIQKAIVNALGLSGWPKLSFAANGGIFDTGSLVWAGENGPEVLANAGGGKTGVMNVQQMSEAVYEGVYSAVVAAMRASGGNSGGAQSVNVYLDGKQVYSSMEQHRKERGASLMGNQVYSY